MLMLGLATKAQEVEVDHRFIGGDPAALTDVLGGPVNRNRELQQPGLHWIAAVAQVEQSDSRRRRQSTRNIMRSAVAELGVWLRGSLGQEPKRSCVKMFAVIPRHAVSLGTNYTVDKGIPAYVLTG